MAYALHTYLRSCRWRRSWHLISASVLIEKPKLTFRCPFRLLILADIFKRLFSFFFFYFLFILFLYLAFISFRPRSITSPFLLKHVMEIALFLSFEIRSRDNFRQWFFEIYWTEKRDSKDTRLLQVLFGFFGEIKYERVANMEIKREDGGQNIRNKSVNASRKNLNVSYKLRYSRILLLRSEI